METVMQSRYALTLAMLAGFCLGGVAVQGLQAQGTSPRAYAIIDVTEISDPRTFNALSAKEQQAVTAAGGRYLTRTNDVTAIDGVAPLRFVIIAFDSMSKATSWNESPVQVAVNKERIESTKSRAFIVAAEGAQ
jgi:uncharacterized protein (DUF1330 family)